MSPLKLTALIQAFSLIKVPLLGLIRPKIIELTAERARVRIRHNFLTKNHVGSMYFGALAMGAELSIAVRVVEAMQIHKRKVTFIFKDFKCDFLKRAESDVDFQCLQITELDQFIREVESSTSRLEKTFKGFATLKGESDPNQALLTYELTLSMKSTRPKA